MIDKYQVAPIYCEACKESGVTCAQYIDGWRNMYVDDEIQFENQGVRECREQVRKFIGAELPNIIQIK